MAYGSPVNQAFDVPILLPQSRSRDELACNCMRQPLRVIKWRLVSAPWIPPASALPRFGKRLLKLYREAPSTAATTGYRKSEALRFATVCILSEEEVKTYAVRILEELSLHSGCGQQTPWVVRCEHGILNFQRLRHKSKSCTGQVQSMAMRGRIRGVGLNDSGKPLEHAVQAQIRNIEGGLGYWNAAAPGTTITVTWVGGASDHCCIRRALVGVAALYRVVPTQLGDHYAINWPQWERPWRGRQ